MMTIHKFIELPHPTRFLERGIMIMYAISPKKMGGSVMTHHKQTLRNKNGRGRLKHDIEKLKSILAITAKDVRGQAKDRLNDTYKTVKYKTANIQEDVADYVGTKPYKSLAIASMVGLAFGLAMRRKRHVRTTRR